MSDSTSGAESGHSERVTDYTVALGLGSNLGDRDLHLDRAVDALTSLLSSTRESRRFETQPRYVTEQPMFLNSVVVGTSDMGLESLLRATEHIERDEGRDRAGEVRMGPRALDIDILLAGEMVVSSERLIVPHPRMTERMFVLIPLLELLPDAVEPISGRRFSDFLDALPDQGVHYRPSHIRDIKGM